MNRELPDVQAGFRKGRDDPLDHRKSKRVPENIYFCFIDYAKAFDFVDDNKLWKILKEMGIPNHLTCLLRNLYAGQEASVRTDICFWVPQLPQRHFCPMGPRSICQRTQEESFPLLSWIVGRQISVLVVDSAVAYVPILSLSATV